MRLHFLFASIVCAITIIGCGKGETPAAGTPGTASQATEAKSGELAGTWINEAAAADGATTEFVFSADGSYVMKVEGPVPGSEFTANSQVKGTYTVAGEKLALKMTSMTMGSSDPAQQPEFDKQNAAAQGAIEKLPELPGKLAWADKDSVTITMDAAAGSTEKPTDYKLKRKA